MSLISEKRLKHIRQRMLEFFPDTYTVIPKARQIVTPSGSIREVDGTPVLYNGGVNIPCRLDLSRHARPDNAFDQEIVINEFELYTPYDAPLWVDANIVIGLQRYEVKKIADNSQWTFAKFALVTQVVTGADNV